MKLSPPSELEGYEYDEESSKSPLPVRVLGGLSILFLAAGICVIVLLSGEQKINMIYVTFGGFFALFTAYVIGKIVTRHSKCSKCQQVMDDIEVKWTPEQWKEAQGFDQVDSLKGADGYLYTSDYSKESGALPYCSIWAQIQLWCACHKCRMCFLKEKYSRKQIFGSRDKEEFDKAKQLLITVPAAGAELEKTYQHLYDTMGGRVDGGMKDET